MQCLKTKLAYSAELMVGLDVLACFSLTLFFTLAKNKFKSNAVTLK